MPSYKSSNITLVKGNSKTIQVTVKNAAGVAQNITAYTKGRFTIKSNFEEESYILRKATAAVTGGAAAQMALTTPISGILQIYILKDDLVDDATCSMTAIPANDITNDEGFTLVDTYNNAHVFKFSKDGGAVTGEDATVAITTGETDVQVATAIQAAVDVYAPFSASVLSTVVTISQRTPGYTLGNTANSDTVSDADFLLSDFSGGTDAVEPGAYLYEVELEHTSGNVYTVLSGYIQINEQLNNWTSK